MSKHARHNNIYVDDKIKNRKIIRLEDIKAATFKIKWQCMHCKYIWETSSHKIINNKTGCPKCSGNLKLNNKIVDERIEKRSITRVGNYITTNSKIEWSCKECKNIWKATPCHILNGEGCPRCSKSERITDLIIDTRIKNRNILRLEPVKRAIDKIKWKCLICENIWSAHPNNICQFKGCPNCASGHNERLVRKFLLDNNIGFEKIKIKLISGNCLPDFYIKQYNTIIEYNGEHHYKPVNFGGAKELHYKKFLKQKLRDKELRKYCSNNKINLIEIDGRTYQNKKLIKLMQKLFNNNFICHV